MYNNTGIYQTVTSAKVAWDQEGDQIMHLLKDIMHHSKLLMLSVLGLISFIYTLVLVLGIMTFVPDVFQSAAQEFLLVGLFGYLGFIYLAYIHFSQYETIKSFITNNNLTYYDVLDAFSFLVIATGLIIFADSIPFIRVEPIQYSLLYFGFVSAVYDLFERDSSPRLM